MYYYCCINNNIYIALKGTLLHALRANSPSPTRPAASSSTIHPAYVTITIGAPKNIVLITGQKLKIVTLVNKLSWLS